LLEVTLQVVKNLGFIDRCRGCRAATVNLAIWRIRAKLIAVAGNCHVELVKLGFDLGFVSGLQRAVGCDQDQAGEDADDGDHDQKLDEGETM
jgi:hypothetical protein